jgi:hypothetical protein
MELVMRITTIAIAVIGFSCMSHAQTAKTPVWLDPSSSGRETLGLQLQFAVKERFLKSASFNLVAKPSQAWIHLIVDTIKIEDTPRIAYTIIWTTGAKESYSNSMMGVCGAAAIEACASDIIARADKEFADLERSSRR